VFCIGKLAPAKCIVVWESAGSRCESNYFDKFLFAIHPAAPAGSSALTPRVDSGPAPIHQFEHCNDDVWIDGLIRQANLPIPGQVLEFNVA